MFKKISGLNFRTLLLSATLLGAPRATRAGIIADLHLGGELSRSAIAAEKIGEVENALRAAHVVGTGDSIADLSHAIAALNSSQKKSIYTRLIADHGVDLDAIRRIDQAAGSTAALSAKDFEDLAQLRNKQVVYIKESASPGTRHGASDNTLAGTFTKKDGKVRVASSTSDVPVEVLEAEKAEPGRAAKELRSLDHQIEAQKAIDEARPMLREKLEFNEADLRGLQDGMLDSDKGKLSEGAALLTKKSAGSDELLMTLSGQTEHLDPLGKEMAKTIQDLAGGKNYLPKLTPDQLRAAIGIPPLAGYLHELPGMSDAMKAYREAATAAKTPEELRKAQAAFRMRVEANMFHNGPNAGFWRDNLTPMLKDNLAKNGLSDFFKGTVFDGGGGNIVYPSPNNRLSAVHTVLDRLDQGTGGGWLKIREEVSAFQKPADTIKTMLQTNPQQTIEQLNKLSADVSGQILQNNPRFRGVGQQQFETLVQNAVHDVKAFQEKAAQRIQISGDNIIIDGRTYAANGDAQVQKAMEEQWKATVRDILGASTDAKQRKRPVVRLSF